MRDAVLPSPLKKWEDSGSERLSNIPKVVLLVSGGLRFKLRHSEPKPLTSTLCSFSNRPSHPILQMVTSCPHGIKQWATDTAGSRIKTLRGPWTTHHAPSTTPQKRSWYSRSEQKTPRNRPAPSPCFCTTVGSLPRLRSLFLIHQ